MSKLIKFSPTAVAKVFLHATKFPHCSVNGVLLAKDGSENLVVSDAIPFFHDHLTLTPMLEVALCQVERYCQVHQLEIAGYYQISDTVGTPSLDFVAQRVGDRINEHFPGAFLMSVDFKEFIAAGSNISNSFNISIVRDGKWKPADKNSFELLDVDPADLSAGLRKLVFENAQSEFSDFDDHLDDISLDWRNPKITERVLSAL